METLAGIVADNPQQITELQQQGFTKCRNPMCDYWLSPEEEQGLSGRYTFTCPRCKITYPLLEAAPFRIGAQGGVEGNETEDDYDEPLGIANRNYETSVGLSRKELGQLGEKVVGDLKTIPGYGPITWWSPVYHNPIDGGTEDFAIEVKTVVIDVQNHRFVPGEPERKEAMIAKAESMGYKAILGILVILDFRRSVADIYAMEMPLGPWVTQGNRPVQGPVAYRKHNGQKLVAEVPFQNPFLNPSNPQPEPTALSEGLTPDTPF
jgi:hypothetical protein